RLNQIVPCLVCLCLHRVAVRHHCLCRFFCRKEFRLSGFHILGQVDHLSQFKSHLKIRLVRRLHLQRMDRKHQVSRCVEHFFSRRVFICHHSLAFGNGILEHLLDGFYQSADCSVLYIAFCLVQEKLQSLLAV